MEKMVGETIVFVIAVAAGIVLFIATVVGSNWDYFFYDVYKQKTNEGGETDGNV